jgi:hypothetical protein
LQRKGWIEIALLHAWLKWARRCGIAAFVKLAKAFTEHRGASGRSLYTSIAPRLPDRTDPAPVAQGGCRSGQLGRRQRAVYPGHTAGRASSTPSTSSSSSSSRTTTMSQLADASHRRTG